MFNIVGFGVWFCPPLRIGMPSTHVLRNDLTDRGQFHARPRPPSFTRLVPPPCSPLGRPVGPAGHYGPSGFAPAGHSPGTRAGTLPRTHATSTRATPCPALAFAARRRVGQGDEGMAKSLGQWKSITKDNVCNVRFCALGCWQRLGGAPTSLPEQQAALSGPVAQGNSAAKNLR